MKYRALIGFAGSISMYQGEVRQIDDEEIVKDLLNCHYIEEVDELEPNKNNENINNDNTANNEKPDEEVTEDNNETGDEKPDEESANIDGETTEDKENVAKMFDKYNFLALPVVDKENRLVGIVTIDDAMDVLQEEVAEDFEKMAAIMPNEESYFKTSVFTHAKNRIVLQELLLSLWEGDGTQERKTVVFVTHDIDEAILLSDRIVVLTSHPGTVAEIVQVPFARPRNRQELVANPEYSKFRNKLLGLFYNDVAERIGGEEVVI